jgi:Uma2 family endonuclease
MSSADVEHDEVVYPSSDGQPMAETPEHLWLMIALISALRNHFKGHADVYVVGNIFLYFEKGNPAARRAPNIMVVKGVDPMVPRRSFKTWVEGTVPAVVIELTSAETAREDQEIKRQLYQELGVREYFLFDPLNEYLPRQLMGYRMVSARASRS